LSVLIAIVLNARWRFSITQQLLVPGIGEYVTCLPLGHGTVGIGLWYEISIVAYFSHGRNALICTWIPSIVEARVSLE